MLCLKPGVSALAVVKSLACCQEWIWWPSRSAALTWILLIFWSGKVGLYCGIEQGFGHVHHFTHTNICWFIFSMYSVLKMTHLKGLAPLFAGHLLQISACTASQFSTETVHLEEATFISIYENSTVIFIHILHVYLLNIALFLQHF